MIKTLHNMMEPIDHKRVPVWAILQQIKKQGPNPLRKKVWFKVADELYFCIGDDYYRFELHRYPRDPEYSI